MVNFHEPARPEQRRVSIADPLEPRRPSSGVTSVTFSNRLLHDLASSIPSQHASRQGSDSSPSWSRESLAPRSRHSRASSIISTRTKTSITTVEDDMPDGFDVQVGNNAVYRLGLDGRIKYITNCGTVPPLPEDAGSGVGDLDAGPVSTVPVQGDRPRAASMFDRSPAPEDSCSLAGVEQAPTAPSSVSRKPSFTPGRDNLTVQRRADAPRKETSLVSHGGPGSPTPLKRRGGVKLKLVTRSPSGQAAPGISPLTPNSAASVSTTLSQLSPPDGAGEDAALASPTYIGRDATGEFPSWSAMDDGSLDVPRRRGRAPSSVSRSPLGRGKEQAIPTVSIEGGAAEVSQESYSKSSPPRNAISRNVSDDSGISIDDYVSPSSLLVPASPALVEEAMIGTHPPPEMDSENAMNDISIHYSRLVRSIDASHRKEVQAKDEEIAEKGDMMMALARQVLDLKTELLRAKSQIKAIESPDRLQTLAKDGSSEARSFSFPPLKLRHIRTLRGALRKRSERIRRDIDDELGWSPRGSLSAPLGEVDPTLQALQDTAPDHEGESPHDASAATVDELQLTQPHAEEVERQFSELMRQPKWRKLPVQLRRQLFDFPTSKKWFLVHQDRLRQWRSKKRRTSADNLAELAQAGLAARAKESRQRSSDDDYQDLLRLLARHRMEHRASKAEIRGLEAHVRTLCESVSFWTDRCEALERQRKQAVETVRKEQEGAVAAATAEVDSMWRDRWQERSEQLTRRMQRMEHEAQMTLESAIRERDERAEERRTTISELMRRLDMREDDLEVLSRMSRAPAAELE
ncbi:MAG: hypothetical protein M1832_005141 [Thelocarpon impressellum]|nr:MAG: hypothetical protein M1832_005141 [Thelocarpon impressellum]